jgi:aminoglycoside/choline kinase family phosphotransferase
VRYVEDRLLERFHQERALLDELRSFLTPEIKERIWMQADRLARLLGEFARLGRQRQSARDLAHVTRDLLEAMRLWYAEIEFAAGGIRWNDLSREGLRLLADLNPNRCGWADACG